MPYLLQFLIICARGDQFFDSVYFASKQFLTANEMTPQTYLYSRYCRLCYMQPTEGTDEHTVGQSILKKKDVPPARMTTIVEASHEKPSSLSKT